MSKRNNDLVPATTRWRQALSSKLIAPFRLLSEDQRFWIGFAVLVLTTAVLITNPIWRSPGDQIYKEGDIAYESIISPADINFVDEDETERIRSMARDAVLPIFSFEPKRADEAVQGFQSAWENLKRKPTGSGEIKADERWTGLGGTELGKVFTSRVFSSNELDAVLRVLRQSSSGDIYSDQDRGFLQNEILVLDRQRPTDSRRSQNPSTNMTALSEARLRLKNGLGEIRSFSTKELEAFNGALSPLIQPSVIYDAVATDNEKRTVSESVDPVSISVKRGQKIVDEGDIVTSQMLSQIAAIRNYSSSTRKWNRFLGLLVFLAGMFWAAWKFIEHRGVVPRLALSEHKTFGLFGFIVLAQTAIMAIFFRLADFTASQNVKAPLNDPSLWAFAIPFAFGSLLMNLLADRRTALFTGIFTALLAGLLAPRGLEFAIFATIASSVAVYGIGRYRSRQTVTPDAVNVAQGRLLRIITPNEKLA